jgi:hypothetical protein
MVATGMETVAGGLDDPWLITLVSVDGKSKFERPQSLRTSCSSHNGHGTARIRLFLFVLVYSVSYADA